MSFIKIDNNNFEHVSLNVKPSVSFISSSVGGSVSGSSYVAPVRSKCLKEIYPNTNDPEVKVNSPDVALTTLQSNTMSYGLANSYLSSVNNANKIEKFTKVIDIFRIDQPIDFNKNKVVKNVVKNVMMKSHQHRYDNCNFSYSNYNTLNFFTSATIPTGSALIYPNKEVGGKGVYDLPPEFSVNFWINPRYSEKDVYHAGTILHMSSSIAISIVSGSDRDKFNEINNFKILVQLSQSEDTPPSSGSLNNLSTNYPNDLIFTSSHFLTKNNWHHVCVQWGEKYNNSYGSIIIDEKESSFYVPSSSVSANANNTAAGIVVGNFYDGTVNNLTYLLNSDIATQQGFTSMIPVGALPVGFPVNRSNTFSHPLQAEIHELKIYNKTLNTKSNVESEFQIQKRKGPSNFNNLIFYVPPFFYPETTTREVLNTPFQNITSTTDDPINVGFSFGLNGKLINLENFTREFVVGQQPRLLGLFPEIITSTTQNTTVDEFIYNTGSHKKRNMTILPNDNGLFSPSYYALSSSPMSQSAKFFSSGDNTLGAADYEIISLETLIPTASLFPGLTQATGSIFTQILSQSANNPGVNKGQTLTIAQRTKDVSSNEVTIFDISNLYYGNRIHPGSFTLYEKDLTGSDGKIKITLKDNKRGSLYRADSLTKHAEWNNVGTILYDEGIAMIKSPHLLYFNRDETNVSFKGEQNIHTMILNVPAYRELFTSSSNPTWVSLPPNNGVNDENLNSLYITTVNIHDDNFNIIMKANFAQPIMKTEEDEFIIRLKEDF